MKGTHPMKTENNERKRRPFQPLFWLVTALLWLLCSAWYMIPWPSSLIEFWYSRGFFKALGFIVVPVTGRLPFSLAMVLNIALPLLCLALWLRLFIRNFRTKELPVWRIYLKVIYGLLFIIPALWCWFLIFWGMGYAREPMETRLHLGTEAVRESELEEIAEKLFNQLMSDLPATEEERNVKRAITSISYSMERTIQAWEGRSVALPRRVKATIPGMLLMNGTSGLCAPFTLEAHVDGGLPDTFFVAVAAHELGHIAGVCDEGETNLLGFVAGLQAENSYARYCVALDLYLDVARQLRTEKLQEAMRRLPETAREDIRAMQEASRRYRIDFFQKWSWRMYNRYLKSQGVKEGVRSYGRGVQLVVKAWRAGLLNLSY